MSPVRSPYSDNDPILVSDRLIVRLPSSHDVREIVDYYLRNREFHRPTDPYRPDEFYTEGFWKPQIRLLREEFKDDRSARFMLFLRDDPHRVIGVANFNQVFRGPLQACYLGYSLDQLEQGRGYMLEGLRLAIDFIFEHRNLHRIMANYMPDNARSAKVLDRLGFVIEGHAREYLLINGEWRDHVMTSLVNSNWRRE